MRRSATLHKQSGITLMEVVVTMFVMAIGLMGLAGLQTSAIKDGYDTAQRSQAMWLVYEIVERMRANPAGHASDYTTAAVGAAACGTPAKFCADYNLGASKQNADTTCTSADMAQFDLWEVYCGYQTAGGSANASDTIQLSNLAITCAPMAGGVCDTNAQFTVSLSWTSKSVQDSQAKAEEGGGGLSSPGYSAQSKSTLHIDNTQETQSISMTVRP